MWKLKELLENIFPKLVKKITKRNYEEITILAFFFSIHTSKPTQLLIYFKENHYPLKLTFCDTSNKC